MKWLPRSILAGFLLLSPFGSEGATPVQVRTQPTGTIFYRSDTAVIISVHIERHPDNRHAMMEVAGDNYYSSSEWQLEGERAATYFQFERKGLPPGEYVVVVQVAKSVGKVQRAESRPLKVLSPF